MDKDTYLTLITSMKETYENEIKQLQDKLAAHNLFYDKYFAIYKNNSIQYDSARRKLCKYLILLIEKGVDRSIITEYYNILFSKIGEDMESHTEMFITDYGGFLYDDAVKFYQYFGEEFCKEEELAKYRT